jgi:hypothetical protein
MKTGFIESHIARGNRNLLLIGLTLTIIGGGLATVLNRWFPALIAAPGVIALGFWLSRVLNPPGHPLYKQLARYGDPQVLAQQVNREFAGVKSSDTTHFGAGWLAQGDTYGLSLVPWFDIAWLHIYAKTQGGIRTTCYVRVWSRDGKQFVAPTGVRPGEAEQVLAELHEHAPWAETGYSPELQQEWNKRRAQFVARVDEQKKLLRARVATKSPSGYSSNL